MGGTFMHGWDKFAEWFGRFGTRVDWVFCVARLLSNTNVGRSLSNPVFVQPRFPPLAALTLEYTQTLRTVVELIRMKF